MIKPATMDVKARVKAALEQSPVHAVRELHVERRGQTITLSGSVDTFYHKQLAQELVRAIADDCACDLVNSVDVEYSGEFYAPHPR